MGKCHNGEIHLDTKVGMLLKKELHLSYFNPFPEESQNRNLSWKHTCCGCFFFDSQVVFLYGFFHKKQCLITKKFTLYHMTQNKGSLEGRRYRRSDRKDHRCHGNCQPGVCLRRRYFFQDQASGPASSPQGRAYARASCSASSP
jgi:hypothetical protein